MIPLVCLAFLLVEITEEIRLYDTVELKNGSVLSGLIQEPGDGATLTLALVGSDGTATGSQVTIARGDVARIVLRRTPRQIYADEIKRRDLLDAARVLELAEWCAKPQVGLAAEAIALGHRALRLAPENRATHALLAGLLAGKEIESLAPDERDREVELAARVREQGGFLGRAFLRAARVLTLEAAGDGQESPLAREAIELLEVVRAQGADAEKAEASVELMRVHLSAGRLDDLAAFLASAPAALRDKYQAELIARLVARDRPEDRAAAQAILASLPAGPERKLVEASVSWRTGDVARAEALLLELAEETASRDHALALGVVLALQGKTKTAAEIAKLVDTSAGDGLLLKHLLGTSEALA